MKNTVRLFSVSLLIVMILSLFAGCGNNSSKSDGKIETDSKSNDLKIEDIDWSVDEGILDGDRYVMLSYSNNSKYTISNFEITFIEKSDITEEQKTKYFEDVKKIVDIDESDPDDVSDFEELKSREISMSVESEQVCRPGESISNEKCNYYSGYYYLRNIEHFNLVEPDIAVIKYIDDNKIYTVNYDFKSKKYTKDTKTEVAFYWTEKEIGNNIPKPKAEIVSCGVDYDDRFSFDIHGWTLDDFNTYVKECQEKGFIVDKREHEGFYSADSENGYNIYLSFDEDDGEVSAHISTKSAEESEEDSGY